MSTEKKILSLFNEKQGILKQLKQLEQDEDKEIKELFYRLYEIEEELKTYDKAKIRNAFFNKVEVEEIEETKIIDNSLYRLMLFYMLKNYFKKEENAFLLVVINCLFPDQIKKTYRQNI